ncbi:hypothetical protein ACLOJK_003315 [Asimina triloba]
MLRSDPPSPINAVVVDVGENEGSLLACLPFATRRSSPATSASPTTAVEDEGEGDMDRRPSPWIAAAAARLCCSPSTTAAPYRRRCWHRDDEDDSDASWDALDLKMLSAAIMLTGFDRPIAAAGEDDRTTSMAAVHDEDDGAPF